MYDHFVDTGAKEDKSSAIRSSHRRCSLRKSVLRNFAKFTGKHLCQSFFFNKVPGLRSAALLKKKLWHNCFQVNFTKFLRTLFSQNTFCGCFCAMKIIPKELNSTDILFSFTTGI